MYKKRMMVKVKILIFFKMNFSDRLHIRKIYKDFESNGSNSLPIDYFRIDWSCEFSPIEFETWKVIKGIGLPFYPEFPVDKYFIDFADPVLKIGIECDGKQHDKEEDSIRDKNLIELGWKIFRIPGYKCKNLPNTTLSEIMQDEEYYSTELTDRIYDFFNESIDGFLEAIYHCYYFDINSFRHKKSVFKVLKEHQLIKFELF